MKILKKTITALLALGGMMASLSYGLAAMSDEDLSGIVGQSFFSSNYIAPGGSNPNVNVGFYRVGVEANLAINANINKLRLGCDGPGGTGACDLSIDRLRLHGLAGTDATDSGPPTDFLINQPFFEFAIKNPTNPATRQVVGIRFGALSALGALTVGENPNPNDPTDDTGLNTLSGDLNLSINNAKITNLNVCVLICIGPLSATIDNSFSQQVIAKRLSVIPDLGDLTATALGVVTLTDAHLLNTPLNNVHRIDIKDPSSTATTPVPTKDFSLSMQAQDINWQKVSTGDFSGATASQGWWISIPKVVFQDLVVTQKISLGIGAVLNGIAGGRVDLSNVDLGQKPADNCWGSSTFC